MPSIGRPLKWCLPCPCPSLHDDQRQAIQAWQFHPRKKIPSRAGMSYHRRPPRNGRKPRQSMPVAQACGCTHRGCRTSESIFHRMMGVVIHITPRFVLLRNLPHMRQNLWFRSRIYRAHFVLVRSVPFEKMVSDGGSVARAKGRVLCRGSYTRRGAVEPSSRWSLACTWRACTSNSALE